MENLPTNIGGRVTTLGPESINGSGKCVLYVMSRDQRVADNHGLIAAQHLATTKKVPLAVIFTLHIVSQNRAREHYDFMLNGLYDVEQQLAALNIPFIMLIGNPYEKLTAVIKHYEPVALIFDFSPLKGPRALAKKLANQVPIYVVDTHNAVPSLQVTDKQEYGARTIRPKIHKKIPTFAVEPAPLHAQSHPWPGTYLTIAQLAEKIKNELITVPHNGTQILWNAGETAAREHLQVFIDTKLKGYAKRRNDPSDDGLSNLSPYLHFGHISSLRVFLILEKAVLLDESLRTDADALIEEMIVRKELSDNFCFYSKKYDSLSGAPVWALTTLQKHSQDPREYIYTKEQFKLAQTHDEAWNAAQRQLTATGKMHGYMRMYWAKKVLEWSPSPQDAHDTLMYLNDFYSIDGGDPNGYVGILWSIAGLHDRPWGERAVYGTIRCIVYSGLKRKFNIQAYIDRY